MSLIFLQISGLENRIAPKWPRGMGLASSKADVHWISSFWRLKHAIAELFFLPFFACFWFGSNITWRNGGRKFYSSYAGRYYFAPWDRGLNRTVNTVPFIALTRSSLIRHYIVKLSEERSREARSMTNIHIDAAKVNLPIQVLIFWSFVLRRK